MHSPLIESYNQKPNGFDRGILCLAGVLVWTLAVKVFLPAAAHTHDLVLIGFAMAADLSGLVVLFLVSMIVWLRRNELQPRRWALSLALFWVTAQIIVWLLIAFHKDVSGPVLNVGAVRITLPHGWELLKRLPTSDVQYRAWNKQSHVTMNAKTVKNDLALESYVALMVAGTQGLEPDYEKISILTGIPTEVIVKKMESPPCRQELQKIRQVCASLHYELLNAKRDQIAGAAAYELQATVISAESQQTTYSRQFLLSGTAPSELIMVTFLGPTEDIFQDQNLIDAIHNK
jgi:hypothetical protein